MPIAASGSVNPILQGGSGVMAGAVRASRAIGAVVTGGAVAGEVRPA